MIPCSRADTAAGLQAMIRQRVFSCTRDKMRMPRLEPYGVPPRPKSGGAPAEGAHASAHGGWNCGSP
eukprot:3200311-Alexandrium_andersonii.AAC.1